MRNLSGEAAAGARLRGLGGLLARDALHDGDPRRRARGAWSCASSGCMGLNMAAPGLGGGLRAGAGGPIALGAERSRSGAPALARGSPVSRRRPAEPRRGAVSRTRRAQPSATVARMSALRVAIADDSALMREGVARVLADAGFEVVAQAENAVDLMHAIATLKPERRGRRHPHAADAHRRGRARGPPHPRGAPGRRRRRALAARRARVRDGAALGGHRGRRLPAQGPHRRHRRLRRVGAPRRAGRLGARPVDRRPAGRAQAPLEPARGAQRARARGARR